MKQLLSFTLFLVIPAAAQSTDALNAALWQKTSVEYAASVRQAWHSARTALPRALKDKKHWTALPEQRSLGPKRLKKLPPAIIVDIDETVLDNSPSQAMFFDRSGGRFDPKIWAEWTAQARARALPGAAEFLRDARARGVTVFYVTNRDKAEEAGTRRNLNEQGFEVRDLPSIPSLGDTLLLRGERENWGSDKTSRRAAVAEHFRIIMLGGDDLNDFFSARISPAERAERARDFEAWWGERWIILPNPTYGSWEDALTDFRRDLSPEEIHRRKLDALRRD